MLSCRRVVVDDCCYVWCSISVVMLRSVVAVVVLLPVLVGFCAAVDPEYQMPARIHQIFGATLNTLRQILFGPVIGLSSTIDTNDDAVTIRCRRSIDEPYVRVGYIADPQLTSKIDMNLTLAVLIHGWMDSHRVAWYRRTADAYQRHIGGTFCTLDWSDLAQIEYTMAAANTRIVGDRLARFVRQLSDEGGIPMASVTLIGLSFGAQIAGLAGRQLGGQVGRIYGLDPAGWLFTKPWMRGKRERLDRSDARYVQCVHTSWSLLGLGSGVPCGHQDFYPNGGQEPQPGCGQPQEEGAMTNFMMQCSHFKSAQYFIAALNPANKFQASHCPDGVEAWERGNCSLNSIDFMGIHARNRVSGKFYLRTSYRNPYVYK